MALPVPRGLCLSALMSSAGKGAWVPWRRPAIQKLPEERSRVYNNKRKPPHAPLGKLMPVTRSGKGSRHAPATWCSPRASVCRATCVASAPGGRSGGPCWADRNGTRGSLGRCGARRCMTSCRSILWVSASFALRSASISPDHASRTHQYCWAILLKPQALM